jgi:uncharacterized membrane protein YgdD (TMEM256/DUF423 family)
MRSASIVALVAALEGASGVALAATAAHVDASPLLLTASQFLMIHAGAGLALGALIRAAPPYPRALLGAALALQSGVALFSADLVARTALGGKLFPYAAPIGGSLTIIAWLALALWAGVGALRRD